MSRTPEEQKAWQDGYTEGQADEAEDAVKEIQKARDEGFAIAMLELNKLREAILDVLIQHQHDMPAHVRTAIRATVGRV